MSSEDFKSLVVTDPDLVDPEIDVSGLRTQTDTNPRLLGSIPDFPGVKYDPTSFDYLRDLNELFAFGLPTIETDQAQIPGAIDTLVDTGGGGQATTSGGVDTLTTPKNTLEQDRLVDQGIGVQLGPGAPVVAPGEIPVTQAEIDAFNAPAILDSTSTAEDILQDLSNQQAMLNPTGGNIMDEVALTGGVPDTNIIAPSGDIFAADDPLAAEKIDFQTPEQQESFLQNVLGRAGQTVEGALNELSKVPGAIVDFANQTIDIFGQKLNVGKTLASAAVNKLLGGPITLVFDAISNIQPPVSQIEYESYNQEQKDAIDKAYGPGGVMEGYNIVSAFGRGPKETIASRLEERTSRGIFDSTTDKLNDLSEILGGTRIDPPAYDFDDISKTTTTLSGNTVDVETGDITDATGINVGNIFDEVALTGDGSQDTEPSGPPSGPGEASADAGFADTGTSDTGSVSTAGQAGPPSQRGGGADMGSVSTAGQAGPPSQRGGGGNNDGCFLKGTPVTMADGSTKAIEQVDLGDNVAEGGKVFATGKFLIKNLHDYKGIKVSGSHMVSEDGNWVRVEDSKHGKALGDDEHTVYVFGAENRRILINDILFTDYFEVNEQEKLLEGDKFFDNWKIHAKVDSDNNVSVLNAS